MKLSAILVALVALFSFVSAEVAPDASFTGVEDLTTDNFDKIVDGSKNVLVEFYAPWCGWCKRLAPTFKELGEIVSKSDEKDVAIGKVNVVDHRELGTKHSIAGFPTIMLFKKGEDKPVEYEGDRSLESFVSFLNKETGSKLKAPAKKEEKEETPVTILGNDNFDSIVKSEEHDAIVMFFAPWCGHCKKLAPTYEKLAEKYSNTDDVVVGKVDCTQQKEICSSHGIRGYPTVKLFTKNDKSGNLKFAQARTLDNLSQFIEDNRDKNVKDEL